MLNLFKKKEEKDFTPMLLLAGLLLAWACLSKNTKLISGSETVSALLCIAAIGALATQSTANSGCKFGIIGVFGGVFATMVNVDKTVLVPSLVLLAIGGVL